MKNKLLKYCFALISYSLLTIINPTRAQVFERIETVAGLGILKENNGVSVADYDKDNDLDLFVVAKAKDNDGIESSHSRLFRNNNDGTFTDVTQVSKLVNLLHESEPTKKFSGLNGEKHGAFWGDYDNDGFPDLFLTNTNKDQLFHNQGNGTFIDVTDQAGFNKYNSCIDTGATWFDYNNDGFLDIYICDWSKDCEGNRLYKNNRDGTFTNVTKTLFPPNLPDKYAFLAIPFDFNNDGWFDLFIANDSQIETDEVFINNHGNGFTEQASVYNLANSKNDMGVAVGDYNNDGYFDFYITAIFDNTLFKNNKNNTFTDVAEKLGVKKTGWAWDVSFSDFDLDRDEDLFVVNGFNHGSISSQNNVYFENLFANNNGKELFIDSSEKTKLGELTISVGSTVFDYDNDGDLDIFVTNNDSPSYFYENKITDFTQPRTDLHWLKVSLQGTTSNRDAIGAKISVKTAEGVEGTIHRYNTGVGFLSQSLKPIHFGVGQANEILELKITWPSGLVDIFKNIPVDKLIFAKEGEGHKVIEIEPSKKVYGCTDTKSCNFNPYANTSSGTCSYLKPSVISGKINALYNSIETYTYPLSVNSKANWQVTGGQIIENISDNQIKIKWGTANSGIVSLIENNGKCYSEKIILNVNLTDGSVIVSDEKTSVARLWNEVLIKAITKDFARPTVHARNLFHVSMAMYDAWAVYDKQAKTYLLGNDVHGFKSEFKGFVPKSTESIEDSRNKAISYAAYRLMSYRFQYTPNTFTQENFNVLMSKLGYDTTNTSVDYSNGDGAALGNYIAQMVIDYGLVDGSNEINQYKNIFYKPENEPLSLANPGNEISSINPNKWQPLKFNSFIDQSGNLLPGTTPSFLSPEWGNVFPFSLAENDKKIYNRLGNNYTVYNDPGAPLYLNTSENEKESDAYKWTFSFVAKWSSHLDTKDGVRWDISPKSIGNISSEEFPKKFSDYPKFYNELEGGDIGKGRAINPYTKKPYEEQKVLRGDYTRVLAEFWADGLHSETPPGHWFNILNYVSDSKLIQKKINGQGSILSNLEWDIKSYFILGGAMHDCAITAWGIKGWYDYTRPISAIRYMASKGQCSVPTLPNYNINGIPLQTGYIEVIKENDPLAGKNNENLGKIKLYSWRGHDYIKDPKVDQAGSGWILAQNWWPYQRPTFVTPPFAGYISGHSTFSRAGAEVLTLLTGDEYFPGGYGEFIAKKNEFLVFEEGPSEDVKLQWATYRDASDQCSLSRIWGGIHPPVDDIPGRIIGEKIGKNSFQYAISYFSNVNINNEIETDITIYPNPVLDKLTIDTKERGKNTTLYIYDMLGHLLLTKVTTETKFEINLETLTNGVYLLKISNEKISSTKLILKK